MDVGPRVVRGDSIVPRGKETATWPFMPQLSKPEGNTQPHGDRGRWLQTTG